MRVVLDSSAALAWIYGDEINDAVLKVFDIIAEEGALVPALWHLEIANSLTVAVRRGRISVEVRDAALIDLGLLDIVLDLYTHAQACASTLTLADRFRLTLYDAAYLELAQRSSLPLASLDAELGSAARALGVPLLGVGAGVDPKQTRIAMVTNDTLIDTPRTIVSGSVDAIVDLVAHDWGEHVAVVGTVQGQG